MNLASRCFGKLWYKFKLAGKLMLTESVAGKVLEFSSKYLTLWASADNIGLYNLTSGVIGYANDSNFFYITVLE